MRYLIVGTGGVGGTLAGFLASAGREVTCIARGEHLQKIRDHGLKLRSDIRNAEFAVPVKAYDVPEYVSLAKSMLPQQKPDVIIVCVKGYSLESVLPAIQAGMGPNTIVIPVLNAYGLGHRLAEHLQEGAVVLDGCIYVVAYREVPGVIRQTGRVLKLVFGARVEQRIPASRLEAVAMDIRPSGIDVEVSDDIARDTFIKWGFISAFASTGAYHDCPAGPMQRAGAERNTFTALVRESCALGRALGLLIPADYMLHNLKILDHMDPSTTSSLQRDLASMHESEIRGQLFAMADMGRELKVDMTAYARVCDKFKKYRTTAMSSGRESLD